MIQKNLLQWFSKDNWKGNCRGIALCICSILYIFCNDHTDKIITAMMAILTIDSFSRTKK